MIRPSLSLWIAGLVLLAGSPSFAAGGAHDQGSWELGLNSNFDQGFSPSIAYYIADNIALFTQAAYSQSEFEQSGATADRTQMSFGGGLEFNVPTGGPIVPFLGILLLYTSEEIDNGGVIDELGGPATSIQGGLKLMVGKRSSVNVLASYLTGSLDSTNGGVTEPDIDVTDVSFALGFSLYFP
jgi:hypothetical protein